MLIENLNESKIYQYNGIYIITHIWTDIFKKKKNIWTGLVGLVDFSISLSLSYIPI